MTQFYRIIELRRADAEQIGIDKAPLADVVAYPSVRYWSRDNIYRLWPKARPGVEVLFDSSGVPVGFVLEDPA